MTPSKSKCDEVRPSESLSLPAFQSFQSTLVGFIATYCSVCCLYSISYCLSPLRGAWSCVGAVRHRQSAGWQKHSDEFVAWPQTARFSDGPLHGPSDLWSLDMAEATSPETWHNHSPCGQRRPRQPACATTLQLAYISSDPFDVRCIYVSDERLH